MKFGINLTSVLLNAISFASLAAAIVVGCAPFAYAGPTYDCGPAYDQPPMGVVCYRPYACVSGSTCEPFPVYDDNGMPTGEYTCECWFPIAP
jgi:hypothetical protein